MKLYLREGKLDGIKRAVSMLQNGSLQCVYPRTHQPLRPSSLFRDTLKLSQKSPKCRFSAISGGLPESFLLREAVSRSIWKAVLLRRLPLPTFDTASPCPETQVC